MADKENNPLSPFTHFGLLPRDKVQMRETLLRIMREEESRLPAKKIVAKKKRNLQWVANYLVGAAAVLLVGGILTAGLHKHLFQSRQAMAQNHPIKTHVVKAQQTNTGVPFAKLGAKSLDGVSFISEKVGFVAGVDGIYKTTDGGATWVKVYSSQEPILGIQAKFQSVGEEEYVVAYTKTYLLRSSDGGNFTIQEVGGNKGAGGGRNIEGISLLDNNMIYILNDGVVWASDGMSGRLYRATPSQSVTSISAIDNNTCYAATRTAVYKTTDAGHHWKKVFTPPIATNMPWETQIQAAGNSVAVLFYGGDKGMIQQAYILYEVNNADNRWNPMVDEGYFSSDFKGAKPLDSTNVGEQPGPFVLLPSGEVFMTGLVITSGTTPYVTGISPTGQTVTHVAIGPSASAQNVLSFPQAPIAITASNSKNIFIVGSKNGRGVIEKSQDGGLTWHQE